MEPTIGYLETSQGVTFSVASSSVSDRKDDESDGFTLVGGKVSAQRSYGGILHFPKR